MTEIGHYIWLVIFWFFWPTVPLNNHECRPMSPPVVLHSEECSEDSGGRGARRGGGSPAQPGQYLSTPPPVNTPHLPAAWVSQLWVIYLNAHILFVPFRRFAILCSCKCVRHIRWRFLGLRPTPVIMINWVKIWYHYFVALRKKNKRDSYSYNVSLCPRWSYWRTLWDILIV